MSNKNVPVSIVVTVKNESKHILELLTSLKNQTLFPSEVIIVDAFSTDETYAICETFAKNNVLHFELIIKRSKGNRSQGRNVGIQSAKNEWIAITDAGCVPQSGWLEELWKAQTKTGKQVIGGVTIGKPQTSFGAATVPFVLVPLEKISFDQQPATRSVLLHKEIWQKVRGFPEDLTVSEDFAFFKRLKKNGVDFVTTKKAIVEWYPRETLFDFFRMIVAFAQGDIAAGILRGGAVSVFLRYIAGVFFLMLLKTTYTNVSIVVLSFLAYAGYLALMTVKRFRYTKKSWMYTGLLQMASDGAVMIGTISGVVCKFF